jgi:hypothetical protein
MVKGTLNMKRIRAHRAMASVALVAGALLATGGILAPRTHAAGHSPMVLAVQAMYAARSFRMRVTVSARSGHTTGDAIAVRQDKTFALYVKETVQQEMAGAAHTEVIEAVSTATHLCMRQDHGTWTCYHTMQGGLAGTISPQALQQAAANVTLLTTLGTKEVQGQLCRGYRFLDTSAEKALADPSLGVVDTLWISAATQLPVEMTSGSTSKAGSSSSGSTALTWSDWNDLSLKIPPV